MIARRRAFSCGQCRWCRLHPQGRQGAPVFYCEARAMLVDRADLWHRCCDKFEPWRSPPER